MWKSQFFGMVSVAVLMMAPFATAQDSDNDKPDPIDKEVERLENKDSSTAGEVRAMTAGVKLWDAELNKVYGKLLAALPADERDTLKQAQRKWVDFRDSERLLKDTVYRHMQGTMYVPAAVAADLEVTKARTKQLRAYLALMKEADGSEGQ